MNKKNWSAGEGKGGGGGGAKFCYTWEPVRETNSRATNQGTLVHIICLSCLSHLALKCGTGVYKLYFALKKKSKEKTLQSGLSNVASKSSHAKNKDKKSPSPPYRKSCRRF